MGKAIIAIPMEQVLDALNINNVELDGVAFDFNTQQLMLKIAHKKIPENYPGEQLSKCDIVCRRENGVNVPQRITNHNSITIDCTAKPTPCPECGRCDL